MVLAQELLCVGRYMTGSAIPNQMHAPEFAVRGQYVGQHGTEAGSVITFQAPSLHLTRVHLQASQNVDGSVPDILKLLPLDLMGAHRPAGAAPFQHLQVWLLVQAENDLVMARQLLYPLIAPQHARGPLAELGIENRCFPVTPAVRLQIGVAEN